VHDPHPRIILGLYRSGHQRHVLTSALGLGIRHIDTGYNYRAFTSHTTLAANCGDLLAELRLSTKVGYFPASGRAEHSLDPQRLRQAVEQTCSDLGRVPDLVFLHNPELSMGGDPVAAQEALARAIAVLDDATAEGLCGSWGVASWNPHPLLEHIEPSTPKPATLMVRAGLMVAGSGLTIAEQFADRWGLAPDGLWGMSPFGGDAGNAVWDSVDPRIFVTAERDRTSRIQAAFRVAFHLPRVTAIAVGCENRDHMRELVEALRFDVDEDVVRRYRGLLDQPYS
jgi:pyridoxine 4-dehydrogenase